MAGADLTILLVPYPNTEYLFLFSESIHNPYLNFLDGCTKISDRDMHASMCLWSIYCFPFSKMCYSRNNSLQKVFAKFKKILKCVGFLQ